MSVIRTIDALESLRDEWNSLSARFASPFLDHAWFACSAQALHRESDLRVIVVREHGVLCGVAPLVLDRARGQRLVLLGAAALYEPSGWIFESDSALERLAVAATSFGERLVLQRVPAGTPLCRVFAARIGKRALTVSRPMSPSSAVDTRCSWESFQAGLSARTRTRLCASWERAHREVGRAEVAMLQPAVAEVDEALDAFVKVEAAGWKGRRGSALALRPDLGRFFRDYCRRAAAGNELRVSILTFGSVVAAVEIGVEAHRRLWGLKIAYDERLGSYGPALQLVHASIRAAVERGLEAYEFLGAAEPWQQRWKPQHREYRLMAVYPYTARAVLGLGADLCRFLLRRLHPAPEAAGSIDAGGREG